MYEKFAEGNELDETHATCYILHDYESSDALFIAFIQRTVWWLNQIVPLSSHMQIACSSLTCEF